MNIENERIKLTATFYNNVAVGAAIAGLVLPYVALYSSLILNFTASIDNPLLVFKPEVLLGMACAGGICVFCRLRARRLLGNLDEDDV